MNDSKIFGLPSHIGRWIFIPFGTLIFLCMGTIYSWSIFKKPMEELFNINATQSGLPYMVFLIFYTLAMALTGQIIERIGPKLIIVLGGILVGQGWILSSYTQNIYQIIITYGVIAGSGVGIVYGAPMLVITKWFRDKKGLALGWVLMGFGLSPFITAPLARYFIEQYGLMESFRYLGIVFLIIIPTLGLGFRLPEGGENLPKNLNNPEDLSQEIGAKELFKNPSFYSLWICFTLGTFIGLMIVGITSPIGEEIIRLNPSRAATFMSIFAIFNALGRPFFGWFTDKINPKNSALLSFSLMLLSSIPMLFAKEDSILIYIVSFSIFWMNLGGWLAIAPAATALFFGDRYYSINYGIVFTAYGIGAVLGTLLSGMLKSTFGSYRYVFYPIIFIALIGVATSRKLVKNDI